MQLLTQDHHFALRTGSLGCALAGCALLLLSQVLLGTPTVEYFLYAPIAWGWIRLISITQPYLARRCSQIEVVLAASWILPIAIILGFGGLRIGLPLTALAVLAGLDLIQRMFRDIRMSPLRWISNLVYGLAFGLAFGTINLFVYFPWGDTLALAGNVYVDTMRDAAITQAWLHYGAMSHGVHGLLYEPYHALSTWFTAPFISTEFGVFHVFAFHAFILVPCLVYFGVCMLLMAAPNEWVRRNWRALLIFVVFGFVGVEYVATQRSVQIATLLLIPALPLLALANFNPRQMPFSATLILTSLLLLEMFARAFHGLILAAVMFAICIVRPVSARWAWLLSLAAAAVFLALFYGQTERAGGTIFEGLALYFNTSTPWLIDAHWLILLPLAIFVLDFKRLGLIKIATDAFHGPILAICALTLLLLVRSPNLSDAFYQALPAFLMLLFFIFLMPPSALTQGSVFAQVDPRLKGTAMTWFLILLVIVPVYSTNLSNREDALEPEVDRITLLAQAAVNSVVDVSQCDDTFGENLCDLRRTEFGLADIALASTSSIPAILNKSAFALARDQSGVTGVFVSSEHPFWRVKYVPSIYNLTLYFMANAGLPAVFATPPNADNLAYSAATAYRAGGTSNTLEGLGGESGLCSQSRQVGVDNVVVFEGNDTVGRLIACSTVEKL